VFERFVEFADEAMTLMQAAIDDGDFKCLAEIAHSIKGSGGTIGAERLHEASYALELGAKGSKPECGDLFKTLTAEYSLLRKRLTVGHAA
jgi:HPt (histidine-containing phosphotransfer) domain-containing protein